MYRVEEKEYEDQYDKKFQLGTDLVRDIALNTILEQSSLQQKTAFPFRDVKVTIKDIDSVEEANEIKEIYDGLFYSKSPYCISFILEPDTEDSEASREAYNKSEDNFYKIVYNMLGLSIENRIPGTNTVFQSNFLTNGDLEDSIKEVINYSQWLRDSYLNVDLDDIL